MAMTYEERGILLKTLCKPCDKNDTCKFGCEEWELEMDKITENWKDEKEEET